MPLSDWLERTPRARHGLRLAMLAGVIVGVTMVVRAATSFVPDNQPAGGISRLALTSYNLTTGTEVVYRPGYRAGTWAGELMANHIDEQGDIAITSPWAQANAAVLLDAQNWDTGRRIVTRNGSGVAVPLRWAQLSTTQQSALGSATTGPRLLNYVRGDRSNEYPLGASLRERTTVLGDIQHSSLLHWNHGNGKRRLYVGANDGMLHVFDAATGAEVFAYVPSMLLARLPMLAARPYVRMLYVDGALAMSDVVSGGVTKTWLVGALGGGGRGLFMLDMTSPDAADETAAAAKVKWEISSATSGFANLGHTYAAPRITRLKNGVAAVVLGNGYNNTGNGRASLLVVNADTGALIREIDTGVGTTGSPNGLSSPTLVDTDGDGMVDLVYAGDIDGNLWRFNLGTADPNGFTVTRMMTTSPAQAITVAPVIVPHVAGGRMALFGTGRLLTPGDASDTAVHYVYGYWDGAPATNTTWLTQTLTGTTFGGMQLRYASTNAPNWTAGGHLGWRLALAAGERVVGDSPFANSDRFYFVSSNPTVPAAAAGEPSGVSWLHELDFASGGAPGYSVFDVNGDDEINVADKVNGQVIVAKQLGAGIYSQPALADLATRSLTLFNWQSGLSNSPSSPVAHEPGVSGGHFDVDLYHRASGSFSQIKHVHEYDDKYDVTGVNFLNASDAGFNLSNAITSTSTGFKLLVANQYLNPAAKLSVAGADFVSVKAYGQLATATDAVSLLSSLPTYTRATINTLAFNLPIDAFKSKDWWGDGGVVRAGLIPTQTGCVNKVTTTGATPRLGPNGERHDGALTVQLIRSDTPASALELNYPAGGAKYGWRVKLADFSYVLAEYTTFWHHPNGKCYGDVGWVPNAPENVSAASTRSVNRAAGSADPVDGIFTATVPSTVTVTSITTAAAGDTVTTTTRYSDGKTSTVSVRNNNNGTETVTSTTREGQVQTSVRTVGSTAVRGSEEVLAGTRRLTWREIIRQ